MTWRCTPQQPGLSRARGKALRALQRIEGACDRLFGPGCNPLRRLGALGFFFFWIVVASGAYLYAFFDTSVTGAYSSVEHLTREQWYLGGIARSLHRYASDALVLAMVLHLLRELLNGRYKGFRWFSWVTGVPLLWLVFASGVNGYWLPWDRLAQFSATAAAEWLDVLPVFGEPLARNFLTPESVSDRFFSLLVFLHIGIPLILLLSLWIHVLRISRPDTQPAFALGAGASAALLALSLLKPALSQGPADLASVPATLKLDWFYLYVFPLVDALSRGGVWALAFGVTVLLALLPWLPRRTREPVAVVDPANCNGCGRCFADCPYAAVVMKPVTRGARALRKAAVFPELCAGCGICAGACPSSTPFRSAAQFKSGIDMPQLPIAELRARLERALAALEGEARVVVFGCDRGAHVGALQAPGVAVVSLLCTGMLPPSFIEYAVRGGADGVLVTGCREGDCDFRFGNRWTVERIAGKREPHLRRNVAPERVHVVWAGPLDQGKLVEALAEFRAALKRLPRAKPIRRPARPARVTERRGAAIP